MRISDWSSDVCSSDLNCGTLSPLFHNYHAELLAPQEARGNFLQLERSGSFVEPIVLVEASGIDAVLQKLFRHRMGAGRRLRGRRLAFARRDRKSTRLNSSH